MPENPYLSGMLPSIFFTLWHHFRYASYVSIPNSNHPDEPDHIFSDYAHPALKVCHLCAAHTPEVLPTDKDSRPNTTEEHRQYKHGYEYNEASVHDCSEVACMIRYGEKYHIMIGKSRKETKIFFKSILKY